MWAVIQSTDLWYSMLYTMAAMASSSLVPQQITVHPAPPAHARVSIPRRAAVPSSPSRAPLRERACPPRTHAVASPRNPPPSV